MIPTDEDLNRAAALSCGWKWYMHPDPAPTLQGRKTAFLIPDREADASLVLLPGEPETEIIRYYGQPPRCPVPDFCQDRNALPELLAVVSQKITTMRLFVENLHQGHTFQHSTAGWKLMCFHMLLTPPRDIVIASLKALGRWKAEWDTQETEVEHDERRVYESGMSWLKQPE